MKGRLIMDLKNMSEMLGELRNTFLKGAAAMLVSSIITRLFAPKQTTIVVDDGIPTELYTLGKKDNPKAVYLSTKKHKINLVPTVLFLIAAIASSVLKSKIEKKDIVF